MKCLVASGRTSYRFLAFLQYMMYNVSDPNIARISSESAPNNLKNIKYNQ